MLVQRASAALRLIRCLILYGSGISDFFESYDIKSDCYINILVSLVESLTSYLKGYCIVDESYMQLSTSSYSSSSLLSPPVPSSAPSSSLHAFIFPNDVILLCEHLVSSAAHLLQKRNLSADSPRLDVVRSSLFQHFTEIGDCLYSLVERYFTSWPKNNKIIPDGGMLLTSSALHVLSTLVGINGARLGADGDKAEVIIE